MRPDRLWVCAPTYAVKGAGCRGSDEIFHAVRLGAKHFSLARHTLCGTAHPTVRQRTDRSIAHEQGEGVYLRRRMMGNDAVKDGWQRFLDRLKRLWGKPRDGETRKATVLNVRG
jgi:hypothetical protein